MPKLHGLVREKTTIEVWNVCECGEILDSIHAGKRGQCSVCWVKAMPADTKKALNKLIAGAFRPTTDEQKSELIDDAFDKLGRDEKAHV